MMAGIRVHVQHKEQTEEDSGVCIICLGGDGKLVTGPQGRKKIRDAANERKDEVFERLNNLLGVQFFYHQNSQCYRKYTLPENVRRSIDRLVGTPQDVDYNGNSSESNQQRAPRRITRSQRNFNVTNLCIICNKEKHQGQKQTIELSDESRAERFAKIARQFDDDTHERLSVFSTIEDILDAGIRYHRNCMRAYEREFDRKYGDEGESTLADSSHTDEIGGVNNDRLHDGDEINGNYQSHENVNSDNDNINNIGGKSSEEPQFYHYNSEERRKAVTQWLREGLPRLEAGEAFTLTEIATIVNQLLPKDYPLRNDDLKKYLIELAGQDLQFSVSSIPRIPTLVFHAKVTVADVIDLLRHKNPITECAKKMRESMEGVEFHVEDKFCDAVDLEKANENIELPEPVQEFLAAFLKIKPQEFEDTSSDSESGTKKGSDSKMLKVKMLYQTLYYILHRGKKQTPLHVMLGLAIHHITRNSALVKSLNHLGLCVSYDFVLRIRARLAEYAIKTCANTVPIPSHFDKKMFTAVAFDNIDHKDTGNTGMHSTHDTACIAIQKESTIIHEKPNLSQTSVDLRKRTINAELPCQQLKPFEKPPKDIPLPAEYPPTKTAPSVTPEMYNRIDRTDLAWFLSRGNFLMKLNEWISSEQYQTVPSWPAFNSVLREDPRTKDVIGFLPVLPHPVTQYATVYTALLNFKDILSQLDQSKLPVFCDEGVYHIARHIQFLHPEVFKDIVLMLGTFHLIKVMLACVGRYLKGSGVEDILINTETTGVSTTIQALNGSNYARSLHAFYLLEEAMQRLQLQAFFDAKGVGPYEDELHLISDLRETLAEESFDEGNVMLNNFKDLSEDLEENLSDFNEERSRESKLFKFWNNFLKMMRVTRDVIRADRSGDWLLHVDAVKRCLPIFHVLDRTNYARWATVYLYDILSLETEAPEIYTQFLSGRFCVKQSNSSFTSVGTDQALEQTINRSCKSTSGVIGQTRNESAVASWGLTYHEVSAISNLFRRITLVKNDNYELKNHREYSPTQTAYSEQQVTKIVTYVLEHVNPFSPGEQPLRNIANEVLLAPAATAKLLAMIPDGCNLFHQFCLKRFHEKKILISDTLKNVGLPTFANDKEEKKTKTVIKAIPKQLENATRLIKLAEQRNYDKRVLLSFELMQTNSIFERDQTLKREKNLKSIFDQLEKSMPPISCDITSASTNVCYLVDVMTVCRTINMRLLKTFRDFGEKFCESVLQLVGGLIHRVDFIFETYDHKLIIQEETASVPYHDIHEDVNIPKEPKKFWASNGNKVLIQKFLRKYISMHGREKWLGGEILLSGTDSDSCQSVEEQPLENIQLLQRINPINGTDIRIIHHLDHAVQSGHQRVIIRSDSIGVGIMAMYHWETNETNGLQELWVYGGGAKQYPIHALAKNHGPDRCKILPALYHLTGSEFTSKVSTKLAALRASPESYLMEFATGTSADEIASSVENAEKYLVKVQQPSIEATTFDQLRYSLHHYGKKIALTEFPPTSALMKFHIERAFYYTYSQITCLDAVPIILNPCNFGYEQHGNILRPTTVTELYPPIHDLVPNCTDIRCKSAGCHCYSAGKACIPFCKCQVDDTCKNPLNEE